jgi:hypothetical protein
MSGVLKRIVAPFAEAPVLDAAWDHAQWARALPVNISEFRPEGSDHRPRIQVRLLWNSFNIYGIFRVEDRYVRSVHTRYGDPVYRDSCVEFFVAPRTRPNNPDGGYFNFEWNAGGALLASHVTDPSRIPTRELRAAAPLSAEEARQVLVRSSLPRTVDPEIAEPLTWTLAFSVSFALLERYAGPLDVCAGSLWRCNFYKCADATSHPHWASWTALPERNFHLPDCFGELLLLE